MCGACALTALAGATSLRAWIAIRVPALRHPRRMRAATIVLLGLAVLAPSVTLTGSGSADASPAARPAEAPLRSASP